jgi:hypothetical protein
MCAVNDVRQGVPLHPAQSIAWSASQALRLGKNGPTDRGARRFQATHRRARSIVRIDDGCQQVATRFGGDAIR